MEIPITQTESWQKLQKDLGESSFFERKDNYQFLVIFKKIPTGNYLYLPYGPVAKDASGLRAALESVTKLAQEKQSVFIRVEPQLTDFLKNLPANAKKSTDLNPKETWILDLIGKEEDLKAKLPSRLLRYYRNASKNNLTITTSKNPADIHHLLNLQKQLAKKKGISTYSEHYLQTELRQPFATLYLVHYHSTETRQSEVVAAGLVFDDQNTRYNLQGAQSEQGRKLHATGILTIKLILDAKAKGLKTFDFWGIAPEGAPHNHPWAGFTAFKKTFAGHEVNYAGTYDLVLHPFRYKLYQFLRAVRRHLM